MVVIVPQPTAPTARDPASRLRHLATVAAELDLTAVAVEAEVFARRVAGGRFYVACVGQFKRGKSSLINALVGGAALPTGVAPVTSVVTVVRHGSERLARIHLQSGEVHSVPADDLPAYVTEKENPHNVKGVAVAELFLPTDLLASGMCLVDTPGLGSVSLESTAATRAFVPQIDAAVVVLGTDPPISADEIALVEEVARQTRELVFVLNKADRSSDTERQEARAFCEAALAARLGRPVGPMLEVSATERLADSARPRDWQALIGRLTMLAERTGSRLVRTAEERGVQVLGRRVLREIEERQAALARPLAESAQRIEALKRSVSGAERSLDDLGHLLTAEQDRLHRLFTASQERFLARALPSARTEFQATLRSLGACSRSRRWREAHRIAQDIFRRVLEIWRTAEQPRAEGTYRQATQRFVDLANDFLARVTVEANLTPSELPGVLASERGFRTRSHLYFTELMHMTTRSPLRWLIDVLRPPQSFAAATERHALAYLDRLIVTNATRVASDLDEQVRESRQRLEQELRDRIADVYRVAERGLEHAEARMRRGEAAVREELERLAAASAVVDALLAGPRETP